MTRSPDLVPVVGRYDQDGRCARALGDEHDVLGLIPAPGPSTSLVVREVFSTPRLAGFRRQRPRWVCELYPLHHESHSVDKRERQIAHDQWRRLAGADPELERLLHLTLECSEVIPPISVPTPFTPPA